MGLEKIDFIWYLKKISWIALIGYFAGCGVFIAEKSIRHKLGGGHHTSTVNIADKQSVEDYLLKNTYYITEEEADEEGKVMTLRVEFNFLKFKDKTGKEYFGIGQKEFRKYGDMDFYTWSNSLQNCTCEVESSEESAIINFCSNYIELDKAGKLYILTPTGGREELKRK